MSDHDAKLRALKILAKSIFRDLEARGFEPSHVVALAAELVGEVTKRIVDGRSHQVTTVTNVRLGGLVPEPT